MKPAVAGTPASDSIAIVIGHASQGWRLAEVLERGQVVAALGDPLARDHDRERGHVHQQVDGEVEDRRLQPEPRADHEPASR